MIKQSNYSRILTETAIEIVSITVLITIIVIEIVMVSTVAVMETVQLLSHSKKMK